MQTSAPLQVIEGGQPQQPEVTKADEDLADLADRVVMVVSMPRGPERTAEMVRVGAWQDGVSGTVSKIVAAAEDGRMTEAAQLTDELTFDSLEEAAGRTEFLFGVAIMFGAGQVTGEGRTTYDEQGLQVEVTRRETVEVSARIEVDRKEKGPVVKGDTVVKQTEEVVDVARLLNDATIGTGKQLIDVGAKPG